MTVSIDIDLNARSAQVKLGLLKAQLESLDKNLNLGSLGLDGDLGDTLDNLSDTIDELSNTLNSDLDETIDRLEDVQIDTGPVRGGGDSGGGTGSDSGDRSGDGRRGRVRRVRRLLGGGDHAEILRSVDSSRDSDRGLTQSNLKRMLRKGSINAETLSNTLSQNFGKNLNLDPQMAQTMQDQIDSIFTQEDFQFDINRQASNRHGRFIGDTQFGMHSFNRYEQVREMQRLKQPPMPLFRGRGERQTNIDRVNKGVRNFYRGLDNVTDSFRGALPKMTDWYTLLANALPALVAFAVQALGVAAAMGAVAIAGAAMVGVGLLGHGEGMAESWREAKRELSDLKDELWDVIEPVADLFSGVSSEFLDFMPGELDRVADSMRGLLTFKDEVFEMWTQLTKFIAQAMDGMVEHQDIIKGLWEEFQGVIGSNIIGFLSALVEIADRNVNMLKDLGNVFRLLAVGAFEVFEMISRMLIFLEPLWIALGRVAIILNDEFVSAMLASVAVMYIVTNIIPAIVMSVRALGVALLKTVIPALGLAAKKFATYAFNAALAAGANYTLAHSIAAVATAALALSAITGVGMLVSGSGLLAAGSVKDEIPSGGDGIDNSFNSGSSAGTTVNNYEGDTINVDLDGSDNAQMEKFSDMSTNNRDRGPIGGSYTG